MSKLTLSVDDRVISAAKRYARQSGVSISEIVEAYLTSVTNPTPFRLGNTPILDSVKGTLKKADPQEFKKHLSIKYR